MALFQRDGMKLELIRPTNFGSEKEIQTLIERNLEAVFNCRLVATEFSTGAQHAGRIDSLALSEDDNPVIIEYKKVESSELINQSLYYLSWLDDHRGDFQVAVNRAMGKPTDVDWSAIRVICIAPGYKKFDLHAVQMMGANIELWQYRSYHNGAFSLEEVFRRSTSLVATPMPSPEGGQPLLTPGKKAALTRATGVYSYEEHLEDVADSIVELANELREFILNLDESVEEAPKKLYVAYKVTQNFVCMEIQKSKLYLFLKLDPDELSPLPANARDVRQIGHYGTGDLELTIRTKEDVELARPLIKAAFERTGG